MSSYRLRVPVSKYGHVSYSTTYLLTVMIKNLFKYGIASIFLLSATGCASSYYSYKKAATPVEESLPRKSFAMIQNSIEMEACIEKNGTKEKICHSGKVGTTSSGMFVARSEVDEGVSYVLTAGHSCDTKTFQERFTNTGVTTKVLGHQMSVVTYYGKKYPATIVKIERQYDMCLLQVHGVMRHPKPIKVAKAPPRLGQRVYNLAAPLGIFSPKAVLTFEGLFAGYNSKGFGLFTLPTKPGSSGSSIVNANGEIVGMIFAGFRQIENIAITSPHEAIRIFVSKTVAIGEMALFNEKKLVEQRIIELIK